MTSKIQTSSHGPSWFGSCLSLIATLLLTLPQWLWPSFHPSPISEPFVVLFPRIFQFQIFALLAPFSVVCLNVTFHRQVSADHPREFSALPAHLDCCFVLYIGIFTIWNYLVYVFIVCHPASNRNFALFITIALLLQRVPGTWWVTKKYFFKWKKKKKNSILRSWLLTVLWATT